MHIKISIKEQKLHVYRNDNEWVKSFVISTAEKGAGQNKGSFCTPLGQEKYGTHQCQKLTQKKIGF
jgi:hypothetical protein